MAFKKLVYNPDQVKLASSQSNFDISRAFKSLRAEQLALNWKTANQFRDNWAHYINSRKLADVVTNAYAHTAKDNQGVVQTRLWHRGMQLPGGPQSNPMKCPFEFLQVYRMAAECNRARKTLRDGMFNVTDTFKARAGVVMAHALEDALGLRNTNFGFSLVNAKWDDQDFVTEFKTSSLPCGSASNRSTVTFIRSNIRPTGLTFKKEKQPNGRYLISYEAVVPLDWHSSVVGTIGTGAIIFKIEGRGNKPGWVLSANRCPPSEEEEEMEVFTFDCQMGSFSEDSGIGRGRTDITRMFIARNYRHKFIALSTVHAEAVNLMKQMLTDMVVEELRKAA